VWIRGETAAEIFTSQTYTATRASTHRPSVEEPRGMTRGWHSGTLRGYIRVAITRRKTQIRYSIIVRRARARTIVREAIKERRDNVNDENRDVRAASDEHRFKKALLHAHVHAHCRYIPPRLIAVWSLARTIPRKAALVGPRYPRTETEGRRAPVESRIKPISRRYCLMKNDEYGATHGKHR